MVDAYFVKQSKISAKFHCEPVHFEKPIGSRTCQNVTEQCDLLYDPFALIAFNRFVNWLVVTVIPLKLCAEGVIIIQDLSLVLSWGWGPPIQVLAGAHGVCSSPGPCWGLRGIPIQDQGYKTGVRQDKRYTRQIGPGQDQACGVPCPPPSTTPRAVHILQLRRRTFLLKQWNSLKLMRSTLLHEKSSSLNYSWKFIRIAQYFTLARS